MGCGVFCSSRLFTRTLSTVGWDTADEGRTGLLAQGLPTLRLLPDFLIVLVNLETLGPERSAVFLAPDDSVRVPFQDAHMTVQERSSMCFSLLQVV